MNTEFTYQEVEGVRVTVRGICIKDGKVLVVKRLNDGKRYMVLPGGGIDSGETPLQAVQREFVEETSVNVKPIKLIGYLEARPGHNAQFVSVCEYVSGEPKLHPDSEEFAHSLAGVNVYEPAWVDLAEARIGVVPEEFCQYL